LGVELDPSPDTIETALPARRAPWARLGIALVFLIAIAGIGWFTLMRPPAEQVAVKPIPPSEGVAKAAAPMGSTGATPAGQPVAAAVATPPASERAAEIAGPAPAPIPAARPPAAAPSAPDDHSAPKANAPPPVAKLELPKNASPNASASPDTPPAAMAPTAVAPSAATPPSEPRASTAETAALLARGDSLFGVGDVSSARLFYERAADAGNGEAALRLGETYDPGFLERAKLRAVQGDVAAAVFWYRRARELGVAEAEILLKGIQTK
jgi:TPR repeat protein